MNLKLLIAAAAVAIGGSVGSASALVVGFERITSNGTADAASQLSVEVTDSGAGSALFDFMVAVGPNPFANVTEIYYDDDANLFDDIAVQSQSGASFAAGSANPGNLPGGTGIGFTATAGLVAEADGNTATGLTIGDALVLELTFLAGVDFSDVVAALMDDTLRIGLHVRSLVGANGLDAESDGFVSSVQPVPVPAALPLFLTALAGFGLVARRRGRKRA